MQRLLVLFRSLYKYSPLSMEVLVDGLVTIAFHLSVINLKSVIKLLQEVWLWKTVKIFNVI